MRNLIRISAVLSFLLAIPGRAQQAPNLDFDAAKYSTYLEQLGIAYPTVRK